MLIVWPAEHRLFLMVATLVAFRATGFLLAVQFGIFAADDDPEEPTTWAR